LREVRCVLHKIVSRASVSETSHSTNKTGTKLGFEWYGGVFLLLPQRSKHPREIVITPKASTSRFTSRRLWTNQSSLYCPSHLHCPHGCSTIAILLRDIRAPSDLPDPPVYAIHHTILCIAVSCKGYGKLPYTCSFIYLYSFTYVWSR